MRLTHGILEACRQLPSMADASHILKSVKPGKKTCHDCDVANIQRRAREPASNKSISDVRAGWSLDLFDMKDIASLGGHRYVFVFVCWKSRYVHVELGFRKSDALEALKSACARFGHCPRELSVDTHTSQNLSLRVFTSLLF